MKGGEKSVSMLHDNVHDSTGGWDVKGVSVMWGCNLLRVKFQFSGAAYSSGRLPRSLCGCVINYN